MIGNLIGVDSSVGGVGFAMLFLLIVTDYLKTHDRLNQNLSDGISFWQSMYIPIVIAMTATQNVIAAINAVFMAILAGVLVVFIGFLIVWASSFLPDKSTDDTDLKNCEVGK